MLPKTVIDHAWSIKIEFDLWNDKKVLLWRNEDTDVCHLLIILLLWLKTLFKEN